ncbi:MAG: hypothetical protein HC837_00170 [Chloroflexaceae bacterium]|nr:hypothetical protein [Chloroflexaceae bacterium]
MDVLSNQHLTTRIDAAIMAWLHAKTGRSNSMKTQRAYAETIKSFRAMLISAGLDLDSDADMIQLAAQSWAAQGEPSPATFNHRLAVVSSFYSYAHKMRLLPETAATDLSRVERRRVQAYGKAQALTPEEAQMMLAQIDQSDIAGQRDYAFCGWPSRLGGGLARLLACAGVMCGSRGCALR